MKIIKLKVEEARYFNKNGKKYWLKFNVIAEHDSSDNVATVLQSLRKIVKYQLDIE